MSGKNQWVVPINGGDQWGVRGEGNDRLTSIHDMQQQAIDRARDIAINQQSEMLIKGRANHSHRHTHKWLTNNAVGVCHCEEVGAGFERR